MVHFREHDAVTNATKIEYITSDKNNRKILHRLENNDPSFTSMTVCLGDCDHGWEVPYTPSGANNLGWLGYYIGKSKHLECIPLLGDGEEPEVVNFMNMASFFRGINLNKSIQEIKLLGLDLGGI